MASSGLHEAHLVEALETTALDMMSVSKAEQWLLKGIRANVRAQSLMYLGNPGYVMRNFWGNLVPMVADGLIRPWDVIGYVRGGYQKFQNQFMDFVIKAPGISGDQVVIAGRTVAMDPKGAVEFQKGLAALRGTDGDRYSRIKSLAGRIGLDALTGFQFTPAGGAALAPVHPLHGDEERPQGVRRHR